MENLINPYWSIDEDEPFVFPSRENSNWASEYLQKIGCDLSEQKTGESNHNSNAESGVID